MEEAIERLENKYGTGKAFTVRHMYETVLPLLEIKSKKIEELEAELAKLKEDDLEKS